MERSLAAAALAALLSGCGAGASLAPVVSLGSGAAHGVTNAGTLGPVLTSAFGGEIFGWDIAQNGTDGLLTETLLKPSGAVVNGIETFDETTGRITKVVRKSERPNANVEPVADAIAGNDVGIIDVEHVSFGKGVVRHDHFDLMKPVSKNRISGQSVPSQARGMVPSLVTNNQASASQVMTVLYAHRGLDQVGLYTYNTADNTWGKRIDFPKRDLFTALAPIYAAVDATTNEAVIGYLGRPRYNPHEPPTFEVLDASTGKHLRTFTGVGYGFVNGMAIDPATDMMCTTTQGDMDVEFYHLATGKGKAVTIPVYFFNGGALTNGAAVAADPVHHLFLVAQRNSTFSPQGGSTVIVYDERGKLVEYINGFNFLNLFSVVVPRLAVNPAARVGYANGPNPYNLQEFSY
jgi:hypothetical protein